MTEETWTTRSALEWTCGYLERRGDENPRLSAEWLLSEACGLTRVQLYMDYDRPLSAEEREVLRGYVTRRGRGEPLQYIAGEAPFRYLTLKVRPGVLIPRPETEVLVSEALACLPPASPRVAAWSVESAEKEAAAVAALKEQLAALGGTQGAPAGPVGREAPPASDAHGGRDGEGGVGSCGLASRPDASGKAPACDAASGPGAAEAVPSALAAGSGAGGKSGGRDYFLVADICTGSGCIACSIASERPDTRVIAVDLSPEAVALARENAQAAGVADAVRVLQGNLGDPIPERYLGQLDLVASNPPYVPTAVLAHVPREVSDYEPALALDGGEDGLDLFRPLVTWAARALRPGGAFVCELHEGHLDEAVGLARDAGLVEARIVADLAGRPRVLVARRPA